MLEYLRELLRNDLRQLDEISATTGISEEVLRRFANGVSMPDAMEVDQLVAHYDLDLVPKSGADLLPLERAASRGIRYLFKVHFDEATEALRLALAVIGSNKDGSGSVNHASKQRGVPVGVRNICLGIYVKIIKHFRALIAVSELGLAEDAHVSARALFEANLALLFILRPRMPLTENGKPLATIKAKGERRCQHCKGIISQAKPLIPLKKLDTVMRAKMYLAHEAIKRNLKLKEWQKHGIPIPLEVIAAAPDIERVAKYAEKLIGQGWVARQDEKGSFSGLSVRDLAASYKLLPYYLVVYNKQSNIVHGANGSEYIDLAEGLKLNLGPNPEDIDLVLFTSTTIMNCASDLMNRRFGFGFDAELKHALKRVKILRKELV